MTELNWTNLVRVIILLVMFFIAQSCLTVSDPVDCSPPGSSVHGILQSRILEWVAFPPPRDLSDPGMKQASPAFQVGRDPTTACRSQLVRMRINNHYGVVAILL